MSVAVAKVGSRMEAEIIVGMLASNGIDGYVSGNDVGGMYPNASIPGARVFVAEADADEARRLIDDAQPATDADQAPTLNAFQRLVVRLLGGKSRD